MKIKKCLFCEENFRGQALYEDEHFYVIPDKNPVSCGHMLIIPRRHVETYFDLLPGEAVALRPAILAARALCQTEAVRAFYRDALENPISKTSAAWCEKALEQWEMPVTGYNIGINNGAGAGQTIFHLHIHLIPRHEGDVSDPTGGVRFVIPERANYRK